VAQLVISPLFKPCVPPLQSAITYQVKRLSSGRARRITEVQEPETDFGHHCMGDALFDFSKQAAESSHSFKKSYYFVGIQTPIPSVRSAR